MVKVGAKWSPTYGWMDIELVSGYYTCIRCGNHMTTILWTQEGGRLIIKMEPLICPHCATWEEKLEANRYLSRILGHY
jgi:DNA-directed RNA polymerase subunit RPC12/RpoP